MFRRLCWAGTFTGVLALTGFGVLACASLVKSQRGGGRGCKSRCAWCTDRGSQCEVDADKDE